MEWECRPREDAIAAASAPPSASQFPSVRAGDRESPVAACSSRDSWFVSFPPIYAVAIAVVAGDALGTLGIAFPLWVALALIAGSFLLFLCASQSAGTVVALLTLAAAQTVAVRGMLAPSPDGLALRHFASGETVSVEGRLVREPEWFPGKQRLYVEARRVVGPGGRAVALRVLIRVTTLEPRPFLLGDEVRLFGKIRYPRNFGDPGEFDYEAFMARHGIAATMLALAPARGAPQVEVLAHHPRPFASAIESARRHIAAFIGRNLDEPVASEMRALLIGERGGIGRSIHETFGRIGMAHLLVISGLHLSMVAGAAFALARLLLVFLPGVAARGWATKGAALAAGAAVCAYASIAGHHVSTARALVMVLAYAFAVVLDRAREALASLALAAIVICVVLPGSSADISFELSFAAVIAIVLGMQRYAGWIERGRLERRLGTGARSRAEMVWEWMLGSLAVSFWASLGVAPLTAYYFNQFSLIGPIANAVVVPVMGFGGTVAGLSAAALSFISEPVAVVLLRIAGVLVATGNLLAAWFAGWPLAWVRVFTPTALEAALAYGALLLWLTWPMRSDYPDERDYRAEAASRSGPASRIMAHWRRGAAIVLAIATIVDAGWWTRQRYFDPHLRVTFLSVGQGDAAVIRFPGSRVMLIDAGGRWGDFDTGERVVARYLWALKIMHVDWLVLSHPDQDHFGGFEFVASNFSPRELLETSADSPDVTYARLLFALRALKIPVRRLLGSGMPRLATGGATVETLGAPDRSLMTRNNNSMVLRVAFAGTSLLFAGDLETLGEEALLNNRADVRATILKVPHHGSRTSSSRQFIEAVCPDVAVISLGYHNRFHFPAPAVVARYREEGVRVLRTDRDGAISAEVGPAGTALHAYRSGASFWLDRSTAPRPGTDRCKSASGRVPH